MRHSLGNLHDARLLAVASDADDARVRLHLRREGGGDVEVVFDDVKSFRCDEFLEANIVFELLETRPDDVRTWLLDAFGEYAPCAETVEKLVEAGTLRCFELASSYGASVRCLAGRISISEMTAGGGT